MRDLPQPQPDLHSLEPTYIYGSLASYMPGATFGPRQSNNYEFIWMIEGDATLIRDGVEHALPAGCVALTQPGATEHFLWDPKQITRHAFFHFNFDAYPSDWSALANWPLVRTLTDKDPIRPLFRYVLNHWCFRSTGQPAIPPKRLEPVTPRIARTVSLMLELFIHDAPADSVAGQNLLPDAVREALNFAAARVTKAPDASLTLDDLARAAKTSTAHLCRQFRQSMSLSPMKAVRLIRLDMSLSMLSRTNMTVQEISYQCGFASPYHFSRVFSETFGRSPSKVRADVQQGKPEPMSPLAAEVWSARRW